MIPLPKSIASVASQAAATLRDGQSASSPFKNVPNLMSFGGWIPDQPDHLNDWLEKKLKELEREPKNAVQDESVQAFRSFIETNPEVHMGFNRVFDIVPVKDQLGRCQVRSKSRILNRVLTNQFSLKVKDYNTMLRLFNRFIKEAPEFDNFPILLPFTAALHWPTAMTKGLPILTNPQVNDHFRRIFKVWAEFLASPDSRHVLTDDDRGWLGPVAMKKMPNFKETFLCNPDEPYWGFQSWDDFFAHKLRNGARPVTSPEEPDIITSACESKVLRIAQYVQEQDQFLIKNQLYYVTHMLNNHPEAKSFLGGTVYQAFLSPFDYHRWSSPVDGVVKKIDLVAGNYFTSPPSDELPRTGLTLFENARSYMDQHATRALIYIQSDNADIGLMCFVGIGMEELSSCEITVSEGQQVKKGQEMGTFHFGGSTYCLVFRLTAKLNFVAGVDQQIPVWKSRNSTESPGSLVSRPQSAT
ncbi:hypothetical protein H0H81_001917 [Sphagnurus paluster]|uniref:L-tryptophan decarboxylase PsiD-like domain-containing protein n=1 Tax=Sphagnurus paluster TaxID=117069 RepID=A0A9P7FME0_9AGAR|nr:hypothetical protein H0H81_001917 [Sphagnurus paluster]